MDIWDILLCIWMVFLLLVTARVIHVFVRHRRSFNRELFTSSGSSGGSNEGGSWFDGGSDSGNSGGGCGGGSG